MYEMAFTDANYAITEYYTEFQQFEFNTYVNSLTNKTEMNVFFFLCISL